MIIQNDITNSTITHDPLYYKAKLLSKDLSPHSKEHLRQVISWFFLTDNIKHRLRQDIHRKIKYIDLFSALISITIIILEIIQNELYFTYSISRTTTNASILITTSHNTTIELIRIFNSLLTICLFISIILHYKQIHTLFKIKHYNIPQTTIYNQYNITLPFISELLFCVFHTPPFMNNCKISFNGEYLYNINQTPYEVDIVIYISILAHIKLYQVLKVVINYSTWSDDRAQKICKNQKVKHNLLFVLRSELQEHPIMISSFLLGLTVAVFGYCIRGCEISFAKDVPVAYFQDWTNMFNGMWCVLISITTICYGDFVPRTILGRCFCIIATFIGMMLYALIISSMHSYFFMSNEEKGAYDEMRQMKMEKKVKTNALEMIIGFYRLRKAVDFNDEDDVEEIKLKRTEKIRKGVNKVKKMIEEFKEVKKRKMKLTEQSSTIDDQIFHISKILNEDLEIMIYESRMKITDLITHIKYSHDFAKIIRGYTQLLKIMMKYSHQVLINHNILSNEHH